MRLTSDTRRQAGLLVIVLALAALTLLLLSRLVRPPPQITVRHRTTGAIYSVRLAELDKPSGYLVEVARNEYIINLDLEVEEYEVQ